MVDAVKEAKPLSNTVGAKKEVLSEKPAKVIPFVCFTPEEYMAHCCPADELCRGWESMESNQKGPHAPKDTRVGSYDPERYYL